MMNNTRILIIVILLLHSGIANAQLFWRHDYKTADSVTLQAYLAEDWQKVIDVGNAALKRNIDYYYLRMRMGIAYYQLGRLPQAANQYEKALMFNHKDPTAQVYLYNVYRYLGKNQKANRLTKQFNKTTAEQIAYPMRTFEAMNIGGGGSFSNNFSLNSNLYLPAGDSAYGEQVLYGDKRILYGGIQLNLSPVTSLYLNYTNLMIDKKTRVQYYEAPLNVLSTRYEDWGFQRTFSQEMQLNEKVFTNKLIQNEFYLKLRFQFENSWSGALFANLISVNTDVIKSDRQILSFTDTSSYVLNTGVAELFQASYLSYNVVQSDTGFVNYLFGFRFEKDYNTMTFGFSGVFSSLNGLKQNQLSLHSFYYLGKGTDFYGSTDVSWFIQQWPGGNENRGIFRQSLGCRLYKQSWFEAEYTYGNQNNTSSFDAMVVYNQADKMNYRAGLSLTIIPWTPIELSLRYQYVSYDGYVTRNFTEEDSDKTTTFAYQIQNILGGIKWKF
ncbi:MAG: tetratricopeptide repeat protein [Bacteroidetes bacterium]|nr:tetratricopeptide repeat protein [Bacteroidota bacterium]